MAKSILVLGLGNPILSDDTIGLHVVTAAKDKLGHNYNHVTFLLNHSGSFDLLHEITSFDQLIVVDSIETQEQKAGTLYECTLDDFKSITQNCLVNWHSINLPTLLKVGKRCDMSMPKRIIFLGIEGQDFTNFSEQPTSIVKQTISQVVTTIEDKIKEWSN